MCLTETTTFKNNLLVITIPISQIHILFREYEPKLDWFIFSDKTRYLDFIVFLLGIYIKFIVLSFVALKPYGVDKRLIRYILIVSILDIFHFFLTSGLEYEVLKLFTGVLILYFLGKKYKW